MFETFDKGAPEIQLSHREEYWGDRVLDAFGTIELHDQGSIDDSAYARFAFEGFSLSIKPEGFAVAGVA